MKIKRNFIKGRMNTMFDERLIPNGEYVSAMNIRVSSTEESEMGAIENAKGNEQITTLGYRGSDLSADAVCIGSVADSARDTIYWCVHDPSNPTVLSGVLDMIVSYNIVSGTLIYHVISSTHPSGTGTVLNFSEEYRVNAMDIIEDYLIINDNNNPPRIFNTKRVYNEPSAEDINLIVKPPSSAPTVTLINQPGQETYMDTRFISFAYRYKYVDGQYSALSQFSPIAFSPNIFELDYSTMENKGMSNAFNSAIIDLETSSSNVVGIDLVFKFSNSSILNIVEKYDKTDLGWSDNSTVSVTFTNKKVYTTLPEEELYRLFDNVPHKAQAQTIMGNRLVMGNYTDGYDVVDDNGDSTRLIYTAELVENDIEKTDLLVNRNIGNYTIAGSEDINNAKVIIDLDEVASDLIEGAVLDLSFTLRHNKYVSTTTTTPSETPPPLSISKTITLQSTYGSVAAFAASAEFTEAVSSFTPISDCGTVDAGNSLTDQINCGSFTPLLPSPGWTKESSGITSPGQGISISVSSNQITLQFVAMRFGENGSPGQYVYEYFDVVYSSAKFYKYTIGESLHSKRDYEVAIIYMDEYNRSTTALVSSNNTVYVPPINSDKKNSIRVTIPDSQNPPEWATKYKFALKPSELDYEIIYSNIYFNDISDGCTYFLLEGDNQNKCSEGDKLRIKKDISGALDNDVEVSVIDISAKQRDFLDTILIDEEPSGLYMKIKSSDMNTSYSEDYILDSGLRKDSSTITGNPFIIYPIYSDNPNYNATDPISSSNPRYLPWEIPAGSIVEIYIKFEGTNLDGDVRTYTLERQVTATKDYSSLYDMVEAENIDLTNGISTTDGEEIETVYFNELYENITGTGTDYIRNPIVDTEFRIQFGWWNPDDSAGDAQTGQMYLGLRNNDDGTGIFQKTECRVKIITGGNLFVFETIPTEADNDIFYEGSQTFDITAGRHEGNVQNQTTSLPAIIDLNFFDCYSFGNGVESYKIGDRLATPSFRLGERFYAVSQEDYKEADRYSDLTYSGIYNEETNVNRLNEFNLSLANFKQLERSFGPIRVISGRANDILVLQEDKVSYVLSSKNLISSSQGGGTVASIPEVLGTQIARIENFGIGNNPESYTEYGYDKYFVDPKRGAVIKLTGSGQAEQLSVISEFGMRSWFRDYFRLTPNTQKLGGYDPYTGEYVIAGNLNTVPSDPFVSSCGEEVTVTTDETFRTWEVILAPGSGEITVDYTVGILPMGEDVTFEIIHDGSTYSSGAVTSSGSFTFTKSVGVDVATVEVTLSSSFTTSYAVEVGCATENGPRMTQVVLAPDDETAQYIHNDFYWTQGTYVSPTQSNLSTLQNTSNTYNVSLFQSFEGNAGAGMIPPESGGQVTIRIQSTKKGFDNFDFGSSSLKYLLSTTDYSDSDVDIASMLSAATTLTPIQNPSTGVYYYDITYTQTPQFSPYIYLIYDYR
jgi:hypothetical protein